MEVGGIVNNNNCNLFKDAFKYYKKKQPPPDLSSVIDFYNYKQFQVHGVQEYSLDSSFTDGELQKYGLVNVSEWRAYQVDRHPGFIFIRNPFSDDGIKYWTSQCLEHYSQKPYYTNLDKQEVTENNMESLILNRLRWATLGYHHNWDTKEYSEELKSEFPPDLSGLSTLVAQSVGCKNYVPEAAIVNYYALDSTLGGHTDHSEKNQSAPLLSFSFGQSAIFLLGGEDKSTQPSALFIRNGDITIMSGQARLCYHAVPKILINKDLTISGRWSSILSKMRLNLNIRQVNT